jgi:hypothetical protein
MASPNEPHASGNPEDDFYRASVCLARAIPKCMDDPEIVDALAFSIAVFRYMLALDSDNESLASEIDVEVVRTISKSYKEN